MTLNTTNPLLNDIETAERLGIRPQTLAVWRSTKRYPLPFIRVGRSIRYRASDVEAFIESRTIRPVECE